MLRKVLNIISTILLLLVIAIVIVVFVCRATGNSPSIFGYHIFRVTTGSMEPTLSIGDVILVKESAPEDIHKDDIITYKGNSGELSGMMITHMVVEEPYEEDGEWHYQTQGIAPGAVKDPEITYDQVEGKFHSKLTFLNGVYTFFLSPAGLITFILVIMVLFGYEMISLILSYKKIEEKDDDYYEPKAKKPSKKRKKK
ncbi:signal peptidase I [Ruminococcus sp.]|uniref:signal peptidase I n=1 Tax=Ruminococcus sp. TaxID=41978 RepID=UPI002E8160C3|nr:signal peptidase I [Ruminococcus sp.]MEE3492259.1 signal peptidase I [Ruminococcus sp.]